MSFRALQPARFAMFGVFLTTSLAACGGGGGGGTGPSSPTPASIVKVSGDQQAGATSQALAVPIVVQVNDRNSQPVAAVTVGFAVGHPQLRSARE